MRTTIVSLIGAVLVLASWAPAVAQPIFDRGENPLSGSRVFGTKGCVKCHAVNGHGGKIGPDLGRIPDSRSFYDLASAMWNHLPQMTAKMRQLDIARPALDAREISDLIGFLYTLGYFDSPGNPAIGRRLFTDKRCVLCHQVGGAGGVVGPNLDFLRHAESPLAVAATMWNHGPQMAEIMGRRNVERPRFTGSELRDLLAYVAPTSPTVREDSLYVLPGHADAGRVLFAEKRCVECHRAAGVGGEIGPDLVQRSTRLSLIDFAAAMWNKAPMMTAEMKRRGISVPDLRPWEMADIVAYLYSVRYFGPVGDARRGVILASDRGCFGCHALYGERGKTASDLKRAPSLRSRASAIAALWNHVVIAPVGGTVHAWPTFRAEEMADLIAYLESLNR